MRLHSQRLFTALAALAMVAACGGTTAPAAPGVPATVDLKIMVGGLNKQIYLPNMLAQQLGYFKDQQLNITLVDEGSGQGSEEEVVAGNVDAGSGAYSHPMELNALGKKIETICQFGIAPGEAEVIDAKKAGSIKSPADLLNKNLGVTSIGSGTHTLTLAILGQAGLDPTKEHFVAVGAGDTFIAAIDQQRIDGGMTTEPTISRLISSGKGKILVDLMTPASTRAALGGDYPFIGIFAKNDWVNSNKPVAQRLVNAYVKTLKFIHSHTAVEIADKMPQGYYANDKALYVAALQNQLAIFGTDCKMPAGGPETVMSIQQKYVPSFKGKTSNLSETYTNEFANNAKV
ncbi:MAG TPA: ABC transporter substrate-binding protein [Candidatus Dormibacteraeota bacterium]|nr:ABC transporter substrate-binding protein [Candidatus Dormibacteraeota bacterium]